MEPRQKCRLLLLVMVVVISLSFLHELQAVPVSRSLSLAHDKHYSNIQMIEDKKWELETEEQFFHRRSDIESQDYPGSGANHRHEPGGGSKPPGN